MTLIELPKEDLAHICHENPGFQAEEMIFLISTPRSGSTMLSTSIDSVEGCPMGEYFQPYEIVPYLKQVRRKEICNRFLRPGTLSSKKYAHYLTNYRSGVSKVCGVNFHASHRPLYQRLCPYLPKARNTSILIRRDIVAQAVSYYIASKSKKWSSKYKAQTDVQDYSHDEIGVSMVTLMDGVVANLENFEDLKPNILFYEDIVEDVTAYASLVGLPASTKNEVRTKKQSDKRNDAFIARFRDEMSDEFKARLVDYENRFGQVAHPKL